VKRVRAAVLLVTAVLVVIGLAPQAVAAEADQWIVRDLFIVNNPEWFDHQGLLTKDLQVEGAPERLGLTPASSRPIDRTSSDQEAHQWALEDQAEYGTPSEKFATGGVTPQQTDDITVAECRENADLSARPEGWIKNHFSYCQLSYFLARELRCNRFFCVTIGLFEARVTLIGVAYNGLRNVEFVPTLDQVSFFGSASGGSFTFEVDCAGSPDDDSCLPAEAEVTRLAPQWALDGEATLYFNSPAQPSSPSAGEQKDFGTFQVEGKYHFPTGTTRGASGPETSVRFDSAWYLSRTQGSIFNRTDPWLSYSVNDEPVKYSAWNIYTAQQFPTSTEPFLADKHLPGGSASDPLHRLYHDKGRRKANRSEATGYCHERWPGYPDLGQDCDEYPFACTYEGAAAYQYLYRTAARYSYAVRPIPSYDNQESGRRLGTWYSADRILDDDAFHVRIFGVEGAPPEPPPGPPLGPDDGIDCGDGLT
jgi:hypothetical protein